MYLKRLVNYKVNSLMILEGFKPLTLSSPDSGHLKSLNNQLRL